MSDHDRWADSAGAYVLGAMAPDERRDYEDHLGGCAICRREVEELEPAALALPMASPPMTPPSALKDRVMAEVEREAALLAQAGGTADRPRRRRRSWLSGWRLAPAAAAVLAAGVLAGVAIDRGAVETRTVTAAVDARQAPGASAELRIGDGDAVLVARDLPAPPEGRVYQVWVMRPGSSTPQPTDALFMPRGDGSAVATVRDAEDADAVLVTDEPQGGSEEPTREPLLSARLS